MISRWQLKFHHEASRGQACELIDAVPIGDSSSDLLGSRGIEQIHQYTGNASLICVLNAVLVSVIPDKIPEMCRRYAQNHHSRVRTQIVLALGKGDGFGLTCSRMCIAVRGIVISLVMRTEFIARGQYEFHNIISRNQSRKCITPGTVCER